ncbi:MAG: IS1634 family transposase [Acidobacteriota bacterium]
MYVDVVPNRGSRPAILLREGWREGQKVVKKTLANLSDWPAHKVEALRRLLKDEPLVSPGELFQTLRSLPQGHVEAILGTIRKLGLQVWIGSKRTRQRDLVMAMITERLIHHCSKLATTRLWKTTTLAEELSVCDAHVDELYDALDWLWGRQGQIEKKLAQRHLGEGALVLYDVSSSYYEGRTCPLAHYGHDREGKKGLPVIVYGVMTDREGRPLAVDVYPGNTGDPSTVADQVEKLRQRLGLSRVVLVGDRGMLTQTKIDILKQHPGLGWISALKSSSIRALLQGGQLQLSLFDEKNLAEITSPQHPKERLIACYNPVLAEERRRKRQELLAATEKGLYRIAKQVARRTKTPLKKAEIALKVGQVINRYKMEKHFELQIEDGLFQWSRKEKAIPCETPMDGIYVIRTSEAVATLSAEETVRSYKSWAHVERAFRCLKGIDVRVRPIRHRTEDHVRAHIFLCMLAYYVEWHMRKDLAPLLFEDEKLDNDRNTRDPVAPAKASESAKRKKLSRLTPDGFEVHSFQTLLAELGTRCLNTHRMKSDGPEGPTFKQATEPTPLQARAMQLLGLTQ